MCSLFLQRLCMLGALQLLLLLLPLIDIHGSFAQDSNCGLSILRPLLPCLPYVEAGNTSTPGSDCCTPLKSLFTSADPACLCRIPPLAMQTGITINQTRALEVVSLCNQTVPASVLSCLSGQATPPLAAPSSPTPTSASTPASGSSPSTPPLQAGNENSGVGIGLPPPPLSLLLIGSILVALLLHLYISGTSIPT